MKNKNLIIRDLTKVYKNGKNVTRALDNISFEVEESEFVGIMGASGSGKTTLLNSISTIDRPTSGRISVNNREITKLKDKDLSKFRREELGFIFQHFNLLDTMNVYDNIALALSILNEKPKVIDSKIMKITSQLGIGEYLDKYPYELSGGQKQRVAAARAIITDPSIVLADEPTGALDSKSAGSLLESLDLLNKNLQTTILMVTHDVFAASYCQRILFIKDGKIYNEIYKGDRTRREFFNEIMDVLSSLGGGGYDGF